MTTITLPIEIEQPLAEAARKQGTTPERLAVDSLRKIFVSPEPMAADTTVPLSFTQMARAFQTIGKTVADEAADAGADFDSYPLY